MSTRTPTTTAPHRPNQQRTPTDTHYENGRRVGTISEQVLIEILERDWIAGCLRKPETDLMCSEPAKSVPPEEVRQRVTAEDLTAYVYMDSFDESGLGTGQLIEVRAPYDKYRITLNADDVQFTTNTRT